MTEFKAVTPRKIIMGKLSFGCDLLEELTKVANESGVRLGRIEAIGAVQKARIGFYNQKTRKYQFHLLDQPMEIVKLSRKYICERRQTICSRAYHAGRQSGKILWRASRGRHNCICL